MQPKFNQNTATEFCVPALPKKPETYFVTQWFILMYMYKNYFLFKTFNSQKSWDKITSKTTKVVILSFNAYVGAARDLYDINTGNIKCTIFMIFYRYTRCM